MFELLVLDGGLDLFWHLNQFLLGSVENRLSVKIVPEKIVSLLVLDGRQKFCR
jgi:hypothetical protein